MFTPRLSALALCAITLLATSAFSAAGESQASHICRYCESHGHAYGSFAAETPAANGRNYPPHRAIDVLHVKIDVTPDFTKRTIAGQTTITFVPIARPAATLTLDAVDLKVTAVTGTIPIADYHVSDGGIEIVFKEPLPAGKEASVTITHAAEPRHGIYFRTPAQGYKPQDMHLWTQGETHEARHWFPSVDYPHERFTSEVICRVPADMTVISNGRLMGETTDEQTKLKVVHWKQEKPHVNYLIALAAGRFKKIEAKHGELSLGFYTPASQIEHARNSLKDTADMMAFFEKETGAAYPWAKYDQVVVDDFHWGGMENTTITILNDSTLHPAETEPVRSSQNLVAHELAHQWFGDYLTCRDWSHLWLNEGFATYYAHLYNGHKHGRDDLLYGMFRDRQRIVGNKDERRPIVYSQYKRTYEQFDGRAYTKGSWVLHMLRTRLGEELFRQCVSAYVKANANRSVVTQDLQQAFERTSGLSFEQFFDQWVFHARHPELTVTQSYDGTNKLAKISVKQTQKVDESVLLFSFPVKLRFRTEQGVVERMVEVTEREQDFFVPLPGKPVTVQFDAELGVLAAINFEAPREMLLAQLKDADDALARVAAAEALGKKDDAETVAALAAALNGDAFWGVRIEASQSLRKIQTDEARRALLASLDQPDARVRKQVVQDIGSLYHPEARATLAGIIERGDAHVDVLAEAIEGLGRYGGDAAGQQLTALLDSDSWRQTIMLSAIRGIRRLDDPAHAPALMAALKKREAELRSRDFADAFDTLAFIVRHEEDRADVRQFLTGYLNHAKRDVQVRAIRALGTLADPKALPAVEAFDTGNDDDPVSRAAGEAVKSLRANKTAPVELRDLRDEVEKLRKANEELRKDMQELKSTLKALNEAAAK